MIFIKQSVSHFAVDIQPLRLEVGTLIPIQFEPPQAIQDHLHCPLYFAGNIGIFNAQNELTSIAASEEPVEQGSPDVAQMWVSRGAGGEANSNWCF